MDSLELKRFADLKPSQMPFGLHAVLNMDSVPEWKPTKDVVSNAFRPSCRFECYVAREIVGGKTVGLKCLSAFMPF